MSALHPTQVTDILGEPWVSETIGLPPDDEGAVVATVVSQRSERPTGRAVLHVHGFADYFFQTEYAQWWLDRGYDFYALDLRKYGRSIRPHQTPMYIADVHDYYAELDLAWWRIVQRDEHRHVVLSAHSTGGLIASLWANTRRSPELGGLVLNSPWFDLQGAAWMRSLPAGALLDRLARHRPMRIIPRDVSGGYGRSLHASTGGEWDFDLAWKPFESFPARIGWLHAVRRGHAELHRGLDVPAPVLVLSSAQSGGDVSTTDVVLDVDQIRRWSPAVGRHVTYAAIEGARHDVVLSHAGARERVYDELQRWARAYL